MKNAGEWTGRVEISQEEIPGSKRSMYGYILTYSSLKRENLQALCSQRMGLDFLRPQLPTAGEQPDNNNSINVTMTDAGDDDHDC